MGPARRRVADTLPRLASFVLEMQCQVRRWGSPATGGIALGQVARGARLRAKGIMIKWLLRVAAAAAAIAALVSLPLLHAVLVAVNFAIHWLVMSLQLITSRLRRPKLKRRSMKAFEPFVSIHVPAHNEPPELMKQTLRSLSRLDWPNYEVLVIDNNTDDDAIWKPVREYCRELGPRFRFFHVEKLAGFKAGALNHVRRFMDPRAKYIFVVDADYTVNRDALRVALSYFGDPKTGLIQFPQDYRNVGPGNIGVALDMKHFFSGYMTMANVLHCVPSTGTLSLISVEALRKVGGFNTEMITEDADLGFKMSLQDYRPVYVNRTIGKGVMPHDLEDLKNQRWRWAFGNAQILLFNWRQILFSRELHWKQKLGFVCHLTAWFNFNLIPSASLIILAPIAVMGRLSGLQEVIIAFSGLTVTTFMLMRFGTMFYSLRRDGHSLREIWLAFLTHLGLGWVLCASWLKCLWDCHAPFIRTNKFVGRFMPGPLRSTIAELTLGIGLLTASVILAATDFVLGPVAALIMAIARLLVYWVWQQMRNTWQLSQSLTTQARSRRPAVPRVSEAESSLESRLVKTGGLQRGLAEAIEFSRGSPAQSTDLR